MRTRLLGVLAVLALLPLGGCISLPESGPVVETSNEGSPSQSDAMNINPRGPQPNESPSEIVNGFFEAMQATPIRTSVAREFLSRAARDDWQPAETITYGLASIPRGNTQVNVTLSDADRLDSRGAWQGPLTREQSELAIPMVREDGEWRIADPPDALIVPESWFEQRFRQVSLYFFDPTATVLVPVPVFVPRGRQLASSLISGLLTGPPPELQKYSLNLVPPQLRAAVSVPVSASGVADVELTGDTAVDAMPSPEAAELMVAQIAWTLRQDPAIERLRISIGGEQVELADGETEFSIESGDRFAPYVAGSSTLLYGLADGRMVAGSAQNLDPVSGPFGQPDLGLRSISPDLRADRAAGVSADGSTLYVAPFRPGADPVAEPVLQPITGAEDLLDPAWDFSGRLWSIERRSEGATVRYLQGDRVETLDVPGITGADVKDFLVSRDGSRLVAVVRRGTRDDAVVVSRILSSAQGRVLEALPAVDVTGEDSRGLRIRDIAWRSPTSIVVLHPIAPRLFQVRTATVDGAPTGLGTISLTLDGAIIGLAGTPAPDESIYAVARGLLTDISGGPQAGSLGIDPAVTSLGYVG